MDGLGADNVASEAMKKKKIQYNSRYSFQAFVNELYVNGYQ